MGLNNVIFILFDQSLCYCLETEPSRTLETPAKTCKKSSFQKKGNAIVTHKMSRSRAFVGILDSQDVKKQYVKVQNRERTGVVFYGEAECLISSGEMADTPHICHFLPTRCQFPEGRVAATAKFLINLSFL